MVHGAVKWLFKGLAALALVLFLLGAGLALRLSHGPLPLDLLTPYIEEAINGPDARVALSIGGTDLHWGGLKTPFDLRVRDLTARDRDTGAVIAMVPDASLTLDPLPLLRDGTLDLKDVTIRGASLNLRRETDGTLTLAMTDGADTPGVEHRADTVAGAVRGVLRELGLDDDGTPAAAALPTELRITNARITLDDRMTDVVWQVPQADILLRRDHNRVAAQAALALATPTGGTSRLDLVASLERGGVMDATLTLHALRPADFAAADEALADLAGLDLPLSGTVEATASLEGERIGLDLLTASLTAGAGVLVLPDPVHHAYALDGIRLKLSASDDLRHVVVNDLTITVAGAPPTVIGLRAAAVQGPDGVEATADVTLDRVATDRLVELWPGDVAPNAREWIIEHLSDGDVSGLGLHVALAGADADTLALTALDGRAQVRGVTVDYLPPMPTVADAAAELIFEQEAVRLVLSGGRVFDLSVTGGELVFDKLHGDDPTADIRVGVQGPLVDALRLVDSPPLGYVSRYGLPLKGVKGRQVTDLHLAFPLLADLTFDDMTVEANSRLAGVALPTVAFEQDLTDGDLTLQVDTKGLNVNGTAAIGEVPAVVAWEEDFTGKGAFTSRYTASAILDDAARVRFGLDIIPFTAPFTRGPTQASVILTGLPDGTQTLGATIDLAAAAMTLPGFGWHKRAGEPGQATIAGLLDKAGTLRAINHFTVTAGSRLAMTGRVDMTESGQLDHVEFSDVRVGETRLRGGLSLRADGGLDVNVVGDALDAVPFLDDRPMGAADSPALPEEAEEDETTLPPLSLRAQFDVVWVTEDSTLETVVAHMIRDRDGWTFMDIRGLAEGMEPVAFEFRPLEPGSPNRAFTLDSGDAGTVLRALNVFGDVQGGRLSVKGTMDANDIVTGVARIGDFRVVEAPALAKILSVAALTGILESLTGPGLAFQSATVPFTYMDDVLRLSDARASGPSLGFTAEGAINLEDDLIDMQGTIVPVYALNSLLGNIPIIGDLITGGDAGGGLFAATYTVRGSLDNPDASVNPLSVLAPGILRKIFEGDAPQTVHRPQDAPAPVQ